MLIQCFWCLILLDAQFNFDAVHGLSVLGADNVYILRFCKVRADQPLDPDAQIHFLAVFGEHRYTLDFGVIFHVVDRAAQFRAVENVGKACVLVTEDVHIFRFEQDARLLGGRPPFLGKALFVLSFLFGHTV